MQLKTGSEAGNTVAAGSKPAEVERLQQELRAALARAEESERLLQALMDNVPTGITIAEGPEVRVRAISRYGRELAGRNDDGVLGVSVGDDVHTWDVYEADGVTRARNEDLPLTRAARRGEVVHNEELVLRRFDGILVPILCNAVPVRDASGAITGGIIAWRDITDRKRVESALRESESKYRALFELMSAGFALCRVVFEGDRPVDLVVEEVNAAFEVECGLSPQHVLGRRASEAIPGFTQAAGPWLELFGRVAISGVPVQVEAESTLLHRWLRISAYRPRPGYFAILFTDISEEKRRSAEVRLHAAALANLQDAVIAIDRDQRVTYWGPGAEALYGLTASEALGRPLSECHEFRWTSPEEEQQAYDAIAREGHWRGENVHVLRNGELRAVESVVSVLRSEEGRDLGLVAVIRDVTEQKAAERLLREANERLEEADRRKDEFLAVLSHELRNPLAPITNSLSVLDHADPSGAAAQRAHAVVRRQVSQLARLVDDLLDVTRIARGKVRLKREDLDLNELLRRTVDDHRPLFDSLGLALQFEPSPHPIFVHADSSRLTQVVGNLLQNASKFTPSGGRARVSVRTDAQPSCAEISVLDTGVGMAPELLAQVFEPFVQAEATLDRTRGGLGLGLALVKGLVELHGGEVIARSAGLGAGTEMTVRLPLGGAAPHTRAEPLGPGCPDGLRVLIIEDNIDGASSLRDLLELFGHTVDVAHDGLAGVERARALRPDVVLCDIGLPGLDGYGVARALRGDPTLSKAVLIALSGYALPEDLRRAEEAGFRHHLAKPPEIPALERVLRQLQR